MDLKTLLGDAYKEGMTEAEINAVLANKEYVDKSSLGKMVSKDLLDNALSKLSKTEKELRKLQEQSMSADEKLQAESQKALDLQKQYARELAKLKAKEIFVTAGLSEKDYESLLDAVVSEDENTATARAQSMVNVINAQKEAVEQAVKAALLKDTPKPPAGKGGKSGAVDFDKEIQAAQERNDMVAVAALIRQKQMVENENQ